MNKKYTLDTQLDTVAFEPWEVETPIKTFNDFAESLKYNTFQEYYDGIEYLICVWDDYTEVLVDIQSKLGKQKCYTFKNFEDALNAHVVLTNADKVIGDIILETIVRERKNRPNA